MILIGYQGFYGSNAEVAAEKLADKLHLDEYVTVPFSTTKELCDVLLKNNIHYGVVPILNSEDCFIKESWSVLQEIGYRYVDEISTPVEYALFVKPGVDMESVTSIVSHEQALRQTKLNRVRFFPKAKEQCVDNTSFAAKCLSEGILAEDIAVICRKDVGESYNLKLVCDNIEDNHTDFTLFHMIKCLEPINLEEIE